MRKEPCKLSHYLCPQIFKGMTGDFFSAKIRDCHRQYAMHHIKHDNTLSQIHTTLLRKKIIPQDSIGALHTTVTIK